MIFQEAAFREGLELPGRFSSAISIWFVNKGLPREYNTDPGIDQMPGSW